LAFLRLIPIILVYTVGPKSI